MKLVLGHRAHDLTTRSLVMGILNRTPDSFYDQGAHFDFDASLRRAARLVDDGADILDVGGVKAGPGPEVSEIEELERVVPAIAAIHERLDVAISVDTWRSSVAAAAYKAGAVVGNDISGFSDPGYLTASASAGASVIATHIRLLPRIPDPAPHYGDVVAEVRTALADCARRAEEVGIPKERIVIDAGLDLGKTWEQSLALLQASDRLATLGFPVLVSASNKTFLGRLLDLDISDRAPASLAAAALGVARGCRIVRAHDVAQTRRVCDAIAAVLEAG